MVSGYRDELHAAGGRPRRTALSGIDALTPTEHRVAALAAAGHSNPDVETHLTHAYQKLDVTTRQELGPRFADDHDGAVVDHALAR